ncbi:hypothetical protein OSB04_021233 [Centaurea solstitialis]|uniref:RING-type E3 ubiquitin transferase n=1 Tax=Centaurea solstitialis TaxID=347529 RepID=A0AA38WE09_9ASTR|nr:hypothetical protein OSB04_021233 [Centaurea solstitialis]
MRIQPLISVWTLLHLLSLSFAASYNHFAFPIHDHHSHVHNYTRFTEIGNHCSRFISSASEFQPDNDWVSNLVNELSFFNGDWEQESRGATLMPFDDTDMPYAKSSYIGPWKVVSFEVENVKSVATDQPKNTVSVHGVLSIGITRNSTLISEPSGFKFQKKPGMSALRIDFEVPTRFSDDDIDSFFDITHEMYNEEPVILPHDQILLVLHYPKTSSLRSRIHGEMMSLKTNDDFEFFDKVEISSHPRTVFPDYRFQSSEELVSESFDQNPLQDAMIEDGVNKFNNSELCMILERLEHEEYRVMPNLKLGGQNWFQDTVGPFLLGKEIKLVDRDNENLRVIFHNIKCKEEKVSGVLRMYPATFEPRIATRRTGLSSLTLSVEGTWNSSTGLLSMIGCLGPTNQDCESRVLLYFPKSFSITQRSIVSGGVFSSENATRAFKPVFVGLKMRSRGLYNGGWYNDSSYLSYNYSKHDLADEFRERSQEQLPHKLITYITKTLFRYPSNLEEKDGISKLSNDNLSDDLKIGTFSSSETFVRLEVLSLDNNFYQASKHDHQVLKISLNLDLIEAPVKTKEESYRHVSKLYLEGVYDQSIGKLFLIGCRKVSFDHIDLERGLDCSIEVAIGYSPQNTRWLINPTATITIASQRNETDVYYFRPVHLRTMAAFTLHDRNHEKNVIFRKIFEGYFRVFFILATIAHILNQMKKMKKSPELVYVSIVMLGTWIIGYGISLIYSKEILMNSSETLHYSTQPYDHESYYKLYLKTLDYFARFLVLVSMFLMARISQMVLKARKVVREKGESSPSEKKVLLVSLTVYVCFLVLKIVGRGFFRDPLVQGSSSKDVYVRITMDVLRYEVGVLQDQVMVPQFIAYLIWKPRVSDGLYRSFLGGLWILSLVKLAYEMQSRVPTASGWVAKGSSDFTFSASASSACRTLFLQAQIDKRETTHIPLKMTLESMFCLEIRASEFKKSKEVGRGEGSPHQLQIFLQTVSTWLQVRKQCCESSSLRPQKTQDVEANEIPLFFMVVFKGRASLTSLQRKTFTFKRIDESHGGLKPIAASAIVKCYWIREDILLTEKEPVVSQFQTHLSVPEVLKSAFNRSPA